MRLTALRMDRCNDPIHETNARNKNVERKLLGREMKKETVDGHHRKENGETDQLDACIIGRRRSHRARSGEGRNLGIRRRSGGTGNPAPRIPPPSILSGAALAVLRSESPSRLPPRCHAPPPPPPPSAIAAARDGDRPHPPPSPLPWPIQTTRNSLSLSLSTPRA